MPHTFASFVANIGFTSRTSIFSVNDCGKLRAQDPCELQIVIFMDQRNVGLAAALNRSRHRRGRGGLPGRELRRRARDLRCYGDATQSEFNASKEQCPGPSAIQQRQPAAGGFNSDRSWRIASTRTAGIGATSPFTMAAAKVGSPPNQTVQKSRIMQRRNHSQKGGF
jgi:hypothetical protein